MGFSENLRRMRKEKGMSQEDLAQQLQISRQAVSQWENREYYPEIEKLIMIADLFEVSLDELMKGELEKNRTSHKPVFTGQIMIKSYDGKTIVNCTKILTSGHFKTRKHQPKYALFGVDGSSFLGEHTTVLGWYMEEEELLKEVSAMNRQC